MPANAAEELPAGYGYRPARVPLATIVWWASIDRDSSYTDAANELDELSDLIPHVELLARVRIGQAARVSRRPPAS